MHHFIYHRQYSVVYDWHHGGYVQLQTPTSTGTREELAQRYDDDDDDDDVVDSRSGLTETGSTQLSVIIYAACALDFVSMATNCKQKTQTL